MNQMWFYQKPVQFHCSLWVLLLTHCLTLGDFFETVHADTVAKSNITLQKHQLKELWLLCPEEAQSILHIPLLYHHLALPKMASICKHSQDQEKSYMPTLLQIQQIQTAELARPSLLLSASFVSLPIMHYLC